MLKIIDIEKSYKKNNVLKGVNTTITKGEIKAIVGVNGAGKSTLLEIICGVKSADNGVVLVNDINICDRKSRNVIKRLIGYMPQTFNLYLDLTVEENLKYLCAIYMINPKEVVEDILKTCYLEKKRKVLAKNLSGGYKQLLCLAGALIHNPKLLILDEPTSAMDPLFRKNFWKVIKKYNKKGVTVLLITHHIEELLECNSFACLSGGKIVYDGTVESFKENGFINIEDILSKFN